LPNGQTAHSKWYESQSSRGLQKMTCVKVCRSIISHCRL
jgi:hypothetical protein